MPGFQRVYEELKDEGFVALGVTLDPFSSYNEVVNFMNEVGVSYPVGFDPGEFFEGFTGKPIRAVPTSFILGKGGRIRMRQVGTLSEETLRSVVRTLLAEEAGAAGESGG